MMIYEIREYTTVPGRMPALVKRFKDHTLGYFRKHGMEVVFITLTELGSNSNNELVYVLRFDSYDDMVTKWAAMQADPGVAGGPQRQRGRRPDRRGGQQAGAQPGRVRGRSLDIGPLRGNFPLRSRARGCGGAVR